MAQAYAGMELPCFTRGNTPIVNQQYADAVRKHALHVCDKDDACPPRKVCSAQPHSNHG
jgi:hypothetical protein